MSIEKIVANIDARIAALQSDIQPLLDAKVALLVDSAAPKATRRRVVAPETPAVAMPDVTPQLAMRTPKPKSRPGRRAKIDPVPSGKLIALLEGSSGLTSAAMARETGGDVNQIRVLLNELAEVGDVRKTGARAGTRWHLVTEDEQIAARAAEIEAQMRGATTAASGQAATQPARATRARVRRS